MDRANLMIVANRLGFRMRTSVFPPLFSVRRPPFAVAIL
jgi:hypothetical protein